ncbi:orotate phosphoribosyltransferase [Aerococcus sp. UMB7834]|uniref:orotate phosphoribosyltransferase n=1 Tax=Aerococcus sp. UMB7834 TaxID=3046342 RepID=UPI00254A8697|nr:orotate phosphoribosyltransferase [Aerococcus sp. UMB7834]MDK6805687.1 orotate phosphoribosyltransferase [Aerococcus sp. UMB7834]
MSQAEKIAQALLDIHAISLRPNQPFTWTSGLKSPIYCDNRLTISHPEVRQLLIDGFLATIKDKCPDIEVVAGTATAGIPHAAFIAQALGLPMIYVRDKAKGHGKQNAIEGEFEKGTKVLMVEDLISTGGSVIHAAHQVQEAGGEVVAALAIFNYLLPASREAFAKEDFPLYTLSDFKTLIPIAAKEDPEVEAARDVLEQWYQDPQAWTASHSD